MSDPTVKPGAPSEKAVAREASGAHSKALGPLSKLDRTLLRLNKLIATPGGLSSLLSTFNYTLYLLIHLEAKSVPLRIMLQVLLKREEISIPDLRNSHLAALSGVISQARTTLRLTGLLPLYAWARVLSAGPKPGQDAVLYTTDVSQCALYMAFQFLENVAFLTDSKVLPGAWTSRWTEKTGGTTAALYLWSYRTWMLAVVCDLVRLGREAQLEREKRSRRSAAQSNDVAVQDADKEFDAKWRSAVISPLAWLPMAYHYAAWTPQGVPGWNMGWLALTGGIAGFQKFKMLWDATA